MRITREVVLGDNRITVRELTVGEIRAWLAEIDSLSADAVDLLLLSDISIPELLRMCDLDPTRVDSLTPSELDQVLDAARECNGRFFGMRGRLAQLGRATPNAS